MPITTQNWYINGHEQIGRMELPESSGWQRPLAAAVIIRAAKDYVAGSQDARDFLIGRYPHDEISTLWFQQAGYPGPIPEYMLEAFAERIAEDARIRSDGAIHAAANRGKGTDKKRREDKAGRRRAIKKGKGNIKCST